MKSLFKIIATAGLAFTLASCGTANDVYGNNYPNNGTVYRSSDGTVYRQGEIYRDRNGNVYQNGRVIRTGDVLGRPGVLGRNGNNTVYYPNGNAKRLPPGQAKKIYGGNAKDYAYGQTKKRPGSWNNNPNWQDDDRYGDYKKGKYKKDKHKKGKKNYK